jgi:hypothetical protein
MSRRDRAIGKPKRVGGQFTNHDCGANLASLAGATLTEEMNVAKEYEFAAQV